MPKFFSSLSIADAPAASRPFLEHAAQAFGFVPLPMTRHAHAPAALEGFATLHAIFEKTSLSPIERETLVMVVARRFGCKLCQQLHTGILRRLHAPAGLVEALLVGQAPDDPRLAVLAGFTARVVETSGAVSDDELEGFVAAGFTAAQALEVVVGIATYTLSTFANRMTRSETMR